MKKTILTIAVILVSLPAVAQIPDLYSKIEGGATFGRFRSTSYDARIGTGWMARAYLQYFQTDNAGFEAGLGLQDIRSSNNLPDVGGKWDVMSIDLPVRSVFRIDIGMASVSPAVGLFFSYGLRARQDGTTNLYSSGEDVLRHFNMGIDAAVDVVLIDLIKIGVGYQRGWLNMSKRANSGKLRPSMFTVTAGVVF